MASQMPDHRSEPTRAYDERWASTIAFLGAVLLGAGIIGLFMFITWFTYATD
ncbi:MULTISPECIES: hypothetical protein [unclassified Nocardioides]|uniref:hypothetical protein n=1 Tax=unclassified Nocardioides TaxID=2615069 RepID=UPI000AE05356|nr:MULTISPECIES: hypothetical protein [unclassified Nocardioides]